MSPTAEMTDKELNAMARDTLLEMGETPVIPPEQPAAEEDAEDDAQTPLSWLPRGDWTWRGRSPAELGGDTDGRVLLNLSLATSRAPDRGELGKVASDTDNRARADALSRLQATPEWTSYIEANGEYASVNGRLDTLEKESKDLEGERLKLAARPKGQGKRLAEIQERQNEISRLKHEAGLELQALEPILTAARRKAQELANALALETIRGIREEQQQALDNALADFYRRHAGELTSLAERLVARSAHRHDAWLATIKGFILSRLESAQPALEP